MNTETAARPLLLLDVGMACTGAATATLTPTGPRVELRAIVPSAGLSPKAQHEKRAYAKHGDLAARLFEALRCEMEFAFSASRGAAIIVAEVPVMGAINAGAMRSMAMALACYRAALFSVPLLRHFEFTRNDVLAACGQRKGVKGKGKTWTRAVVRKMLEHNDPHDVKPDDAYDAAALLFVAREQGILREAGWDDGSLPMSKSSGGSLFDGAVA